MSITTLIFTLRLLDQKRQEKTEELKLDLNPQDYEQQSVDERKKVREEKARKARQQAIQVSYPCSYPQGYYG